MQDNRGNARVTNGPPRGWEKFNATRLHQGREELSFQDDQQYGHLYY